MTRPVWQQSSGFELLCPQSPPHRPWPSRARALHRAGCGTVAPGGVSESEAAGSGLRNESSVKQSEKKNGSGDNNRCQSWCECVVWEWDHKGLQSHRGDLWLLPVSIHTPASPYSCPKSPLMRLPFWLALLLQIRGIQSSCTGGEVQLYQ